jgi:hypothetical protein
MKLNYIFYDFTIVYVSILFLFFLIINNFYNNFKIIKLNIFKNNLFNFSFIFIIGLERIANIVYK